MKSLLLGIVVLAACHTPSPAPAIVATPAPVRTPLPNPQVQPDELSVLAAKVGAALTSGHVDAARALIGGRAGDCFGGVGATQRRDGGFVLRGGRISARLDPKGAIEAYRLEPGCVDFADEQITLVHVRSENETTYALHGAVEESASFPDGTITVETSAAWIAVTAADGTYLAWPRGTAKAIHGAAPDEGGTAPRIAGRYLVTAAATAITLHRADGTAIAVRGCTGPLMAVAPVPGGVALQVVTPGNSTLCMVTDGGATRRVTALGHATCGLGAPQPCPWDLTAVSPQALVFTGLRGGVVVIDPKTGAKLGYRDEPSSQFPPTYTPCGDTVCVSTTTNAKSELGRMERVGAAMRFRRLDSPTVDAATALEAAWCADGDLLVPCEP